MRHTRVSAAMLALALTAAANAQGVRIVEQPGLGSFASLQVAIDAAADGETLLVAEGTYSRFLIDDRELAVVAIPGGVVQIAGGIELRNVSAGKTVLLSGLAATGELVGSTPESGLRIDACTGHLRFQSCTFRGGVGIDDFAVSASGVRVQQSDRVVFADCALLGGRGWEAPNPVTCQTCDAGDGGTGLSTTASDVAVYDCSVLGGAGGDAGAFAGDGGDGAMVTGGSLFAAGCTVAGGDGGYAWDSIVAVGGDGGDGLVLSSALAQLRGNTIRAGSGGGSWIGAPFNGDDGVPLHNAGGTVNTYPGSARKITANVASSDASTLPVTVEGELGDRVFLIRSRTPAFAFNAPLASQALVPLPYFGRSFADGVVGASGTLVIQVPVPDLASPLTRVYAQGLILDAQGAALLGSPFHLALLDRGGLPDCDGNGTNDFVDLIEGSVPDSDSNLTPDDCDPDCNGNGVPDGTDILLGTTPDCNGNGVPDECDIVSGTSLDLDANGVPDECQVDWYVDAGAPGPGDGSRADPFPSIRQGVLASDDHDTVILRDGVYTGPLNREITFDGRNITVRSQNGPQNCTIDCEGERRAFRIEDGETAARIEGLTIRNGRALVLGPEGAGIRVDGANVTIQDCRIHDCTGGTGGGIYASSPVEILECIITGCAATNSSDGGGIALALPASLPNGVVAVVRNTAVIGCTARRGAGIHVGGARGAFISHCTLSGNVASARGGGLATSSPAGHPLDEGLFVTDSRIFDNSAQTGAGIYVAGTNARVTIVNTTITGNQALARGGGLDMTSISDPASSPVGFLENSILWANTAPAGAEIGLAGTGTSLGVNYSDIAGGQGLVSASPGTVLSWGAGNIDADPLFNGPHLFLLPGSPCIDAGNSSALLPDRADIDEDGDTSEQVPLDATLNTRRTDDPNTSDTGAGSVPIVDMGAVEKQ